MKSRVYVMFAVFLLAVIALSGCGTQSSERTSHAAENESSTTEEGTQIADTLSFEYEIQELSA